MTDSTSTNWYMVLIKGLIMILLSVLIFMSPGGALLTYAIYIGIGFIVAGVALVIRGFSAKGVLSNWGWILLEGVLDIILGFILLAHPDLTAAILPFVFGFYATFYGFFLIIDGFSGTGGGGMKVIGGILVLMLGLNIMFHPVMMGLSITIWIAIMLMVAGIYNVIGSFSLK